MSGSEEIFSNQFCKDLRIPLILMVIYLHCPVVNDLNGVLEWYRYGGVCLHHLVDNIAVPVFFIISGYYFFYNVSSWDRDVYVGKLKKRVYTLLVPYIVWNMVYVLMNIVVKHEPVSSFTSNLMWLRVFYDFKVGYYPYLLQLWYVRDLIAMAILSPILYWLLTRMKGWGMAVIAIIYVVFMYGIPPTVITTRSLLFFGIGAYVALHGKTVYSVFSEKKAGLACLVVCVVITLLLWFGVLPKSATLHTCSPILVWGFLFVHTLVYKWAAAFFNADGVRNILDRMSAATFLVYVIHTSFIAPVYGGLLHIFGVFPAYSQVLGKIIVPFVVLPVCVLVYYLLRWMLSPQVFSILTGRR